MLARDQVDDFTEKKMGPTERNETEKARDANSCGRALECGVCLDQGCAWCLNSEECIADVAGEFMSLGKDQGCPGGPDAHISRHENWKGMGSCPSNDALKCDECGAIAYQITHQLATLHATKKVRNRTPPVISEIELLDLFEAEICTAETFEVYGARVNSTSKELVLAGPGVPGGKLDGNFTNEGFKKTLLARRCTEMVSDERDEGEVYRMFKPQRYLLRAATCHPNPSIHP